jgi:hypothetical protein
MVLEPRAVVPSMNATVPVADVEETVAVRVTLLPATGLTLDAIRAVVVAVSAETTTAAEVLGASLTLPL